MDDLGLPHLFLVLIEAGTWSTTGAIDDRVDPATLRSWDPLSEGIYLIPDLQTVAGAITAMPGLAETWPPGSEAEDQYVIIADFGFGTDNVMVIDVSDDPAPVLAIDFAVKGQPRWKNIAANFDELLAALNLFGQGER